MQDNTKKSQNRKDAIIDSKVTSYPRERTFFEEDGQFRYIRLNRLDLFPWTSIAYVIKMVVSIRVECVVSMSRKEE